MSFLCCDWLSNCLFLQRSHTNKKIFFDKSNVVIGFQIVYFYREVTHINPIFKWHCKLWLAFKLFIFTEKSHNSKLQEESNECCDWLSNCLFLQRSHTTIVILDGLVSVVIGFQIVYFYREVTQYSFCVTKVFLLWLAFKLFIFTEKSHKHLN